MAEAGRKQGRTNFAVACSVLSQFIKEKGIVADLGLGIAKDDARGAHLSFRVGFVHLIIQLCDACLYSSDFYFFLFCELRFFSSPITTRNAFDWRVLLFSFQKFTLVPFHCSKIFPTRWILGVFFSFCLFILNFVCVCMNLWIVDHSRLFFQATPRHFGRRRPPFACCQERSSPAERTARGKTKGE